MALLIKWLRTMFAVMCVCLCGKRVAGVQYFLPSESEHMLQRVETVWLTDLLNTVTFIIRHRCKERV